VGGQGTILTSRVIGTAALLADLDVRGCETIGMAQRGGSVVSHVRLGKQIHAPLISLGQADILLAFEPAEAVRALPFLKPDGRVAVSNRPILPSTGSQPYEIDSILAYLRENVRRLCVIDAQAVSSQASPRCLNMAVLGAAVSGGAFPFSLEQAEQALRDRTSSKFLDKNLCAMRYGASQAKEFLDWN
jgi:indolepyruvate ferredoxin oxidoreductase beta subunit